MNIPEIMLKKLRLVLGCILGVGSISHAGECEKILGYVQDRITTTSSRTDYDSFENFFCSEEMSSSQKARENGLKVQFSIESLPFEVGGHSRESDWSNYKKTICQQIQYNSFSSEDIKNEIIKANEKIVDAWKSCVSSSGFRFYVLQDDPDSESFSVIAKFVPSGTRNSTTANGPIIFSPTRSKIDCQGDKIVKGTRIFPGGFVVTCKRNPEEPLTLTLSTTDGPGIVKFRGISKKESICSKPAVAVFTEKSASAGFPRIEINIPSGYKILGGGANDEWIGVGNYLTAAYPETSQKWVATGKAHLQNSTGTITAWAIALYDPKNEWDVRIFSQTGQVESYSRASAKVESGYTLVGGGARSNWTGLGSMLIGSFPIDSSTWVAESHDHLQRSPSSSTAYAIGIKPVDCKWFGGVQIFSSTSESSPQPSSTVKITEGFQVTSVGARTISSNPGTLLTGIIPSRDGATALAKAHLQPASGNVTAYAIGIR